LDIVLTSLKQADLKKLTQGITDWQKIATNKKASNAIMIFSPLPLIQLMCHMKTSTIPLRRQVKRQLSSLDPNAKIGSNTMLPT
jgi:hypothetical protein